MYSKHNLFNQINKKLELHYWGQTSLDSKSTGCEFNAFVRNKAGSVFAKQETKGEV